MRVIPPRPLRSLVAVAAIAMAPASTRAQSTTEPVSDRDEAIVALRTGEYDEAIRLFRRAVRSDAAPTTTRGYVRALMAVGRYDDAIEAASTADAGVRESSEVLNAHGEALRAVGRHAEAETAFRQAAEAEGGDRNVARLNLALLFDGTGRRDEALEIYDSFIDLYNGSNNLRAPDLMAVGVAVRELAVTNASLNQDALLAFDKAAEADPGDARPHVLNGDLFLATYSPPEAHASFDRALALNPNHPDALLGKARVMEFDGAPGSIESADLALVVNPNHVGALAFRASLLLGTEEYDEAEKSVERALEVNPNSLEALSVLAATHYLRGDMAAFGRIQNRALEVNPNYPDLFNTAAELAVDQRQYRAAVDLAGRAVSVDSTSARGLGLLGMNQLRIGEIDAGQRNIERAFERDPFNPWYKNNLDLLDTFPFYETVRTEHFELFINSREAELLAPYVEAIAEEAYASMAARYGTEPPLPIRVELFPSSADFSVRTLGIVGLGALGVSFGSVLVMDSPSARPPGEFNWASTLWHELAHAFHLGMTDHRVPRWFSEGLAVHEQRVARGHWGFAPSPSWLQSYNAGRMPPVSALNEAFVRPAYPEQVIHAYYQSSLVFQMIEEEFGFEPILAMLRGYREGATTEELVPRALGIGMDELDSRFDDYVDARFGDRIAAVEPIGEVIGPRADVAGLQQLARRAPGSFQARLALGIALHREGRSGEAEGELERALELFPEYGASDHPLRYLAEIYEERGDLEEAADALHRLGQANENAWDAHAGEARLRLELGDADAAIPALERAVEILPLEVDLHVRLADLYRDSGNARGEIRERNAVLALNPVDRADALYRLAAAYFRAGDRAAARTHVLRSLEIAPSFEEALELLLEIRGGGQ